MARAVDAPTCDSSAAGSPSTRQTLRCWCHCCRRSVHVRSVERLSTLVRLVGEEATEQRSGRDLVLTRLVEVLLIEALRLTPGEDAPPGLLRGLADMQLAPAIRQMHNQIARSWTVAQLARTAALSRSAFFERFTRTVGLPPMEYLLAWRMAVAKDLLHRRDLGVARGRRTRRLRLREYLQHRVQSPRGAASRSLRSEREGGGLSIALERRWALGAPFVSCFASSRARSHLCCAPARCSSTSVALELIHMC